MLYSDPNYFICATDFNALSIIIFERNLDHSGNILMEDYDINATISIPSAGVVFYI